MTTTGSATQDAPRACPHCRAMIEPVPIIYGEPSPSLFEAAKAGRVRLGGCVIGDESPDYACPECRVSLPWVDPARRR